MNVNLVQLMSDSGKLLKVTGMPTSGGRFTALQYVLGRREVRCRCCRCLREWVRGSAVRARLGRTGDVRERLQGGAGEDRYAVAGSSAGRRCVPRDPEREPIGGVGRVICRRRRTRVGCEDQARWSDRPQPGHWAADAQVRRFAAVADRGAQPGNVRRRTGIARQPIVVRAGDEYRPSGAVERERGSRSVIVV
jgi:hypothetical protein